MSLTLGLDLGTSGLRSAVLDADGKVLSMARGQYPATNAEAIDAEIWWHGATSCIANQVAALRAGGFDPHDIAAIAVDGTSGSMVLTDGSLRPVTRALMYNSGGFQAEAAAIAGQAPDRHITRGTSSALARALRLVSEDHADAARHLLHQADFIAAKLMGRGGFSDYNNALKTGFDPETQAWPDWIGAVGMPISVLPEVVAPGTPLAPIDRKIADRLGLSPGIIIHAGTTDSIAAFLACVDPEVGVAVTSLGTTLAIKMLSDKRVDAPEFGLYSHRLGQGWLVGGASNTGGGVLRAHFSDDDLAMLSALIDPTEETPLDYYPLLQPGDRFPINDPNLEPRLSPRPADDAAFLHGMLEGIARIERRAYAVMADHGAPRPKAVFTAGGGAKNEVWTAIRARVLGVDMAVAAHSEAAIGAAKLAMMARP